MKPYKDSEKYFWVCPICFKEKTSGGDGHCRAQACSHMRKDHGVYEFAGLYYDHGLKIGHMIRNDTISSEQMASLRETKKRT